jgi:long-chain acyl-CoA synthetase
MASDTIVDDFDRAVRTHRDDIFLLADERHLTYGQVDDLVWRTASLLRATGVSHGDRVMVLLPNVPQFVAVLFGILKVGAIAVPLHPLLKRREIGQLLKDSAPRVVFAWGAAAEEVAAVNDGSFALFATATEEIPSGACNLDGALAKISTVSSTDGSVLPAAIATFLYTSGTTGVPKGAMMSHRAIAFGARAYASDFKLTQADRQIALLPLFHSMGLTVVLNATVVAGGSVVLVPRFNAETALQEIKTKSVTVLTAVTSMHTAFLALIDRDGGRTEFPALRLAGAGAATFPPDVAERVSRAYDCEILQAYGLSESCACATITDHGKTFATGEVGRAVPGIEVIVGDDGGNPLPAGDVGEILIRGPNLMNGYHGHRDASEEAFAPGGWLRSGDLGRADESGRIFFVDRLKEIIIRGGMNVYPSELESVLYEHPAVGLAAVIGIPDAALGEEICALVVTRSGVPLDTIALKEWVKERVAPYKYPRHVIEVSELPLAPSGKIMKRAIDRTNLIFSKT